MKFLEKIKEEMIQKYIIFTFTIITLILLILNHFNYNDFELIEGEINTSGQFRETGSENKEFSTVKIHQKLMQPINREEWIRKIWGPNQNVESHENLEKITILCKYQL